MAQTIWVLQGRRNDWCEEKWKILPPVFSALLSEERKLAYDYCNLCAFYHIFFIVFNYNIFLFQPKTTTTTTTTMYQGNTKKRQKTKVTRNKHCQFESCSVESTFSPFHSWKSSQNIENEKQLCKCLIDWK